MIKKVIILLAVLLLSTPVSAQSDFEIAQDFMSKKGVTLSQRSNTRGGEDYSIFSGEDGKGFAVVKDGVVVGYSTENHASECDLKVNTRDYVLTPKTPIEPIVKCEWGQNKPYNWNAPINQAIEHNYLAGCGTTALAQVIYYYKNKGCDALPGYSQDIADDIQPLPATTFNWELILPHYEKDNYSQESGEEVAKLFQYVASASKIQYHRGGSAGTFLYPEDFAKPLGFSEKTYKTVSGGLSAEEFDKVVDKFNNYYYDNLPSEECQMMWRKIVDESLEKLFDRELEKGRPILLAGYTKGGSGHWVVIDGRDDTGRYHVNCGGNGDGNGYYIISQEVYYNAPEDVNGTDIFNYINGCWCVVPIMPDDWVIPQIEPTTSIKTVTTRIDECVYNLQGQKVGDALDNLPRGIYIRGRKKYVVK